MVGRIDAPTKCELCSVILFLQTEGKKTINAAVSCQTSQLRSAILTSGVVSIRDNARPHSAVVTQQLLVQFKWDVSVHQAYTPDLATSDFYLFPELRNSLESQSFQKNEEIQSSVKAYLTSLTAEKKRSKRGIGNLVHQYDKCLNLHGDFIEK
ncbi:hypothetical protein AVEN_173094-1 [Araneus ventricosus]|uniref:Histone-lysine N-methyltransferase SETMAR n=1 Tax=Araneus ventricosus TaxID=182803 RepID=A0A4Y2HST3_ARAVE|nr:hypothetical protein AVEN_173094-1 [Araneus ventricosus]